MGKKKLIGYVYHNGLWYRQYKTFKEVCSEAEIIEHTKRVEKEREVRKNETNRIDKIA